MVRSLAVPVGCSDDVYMSKLHQVGFSHVEAGQIFRDVQDPTFFLRAYGCQHLVELLASFCTHSWLASESLTGIIHPKC
eukprot:11406651-Karenia_brevis.AAC.1